MCVLLGKTKSEYLRLIWFDLTQNSVLISQFSWFKLNFFDKVMKPTQLEQLQEPRKTIPMPSRSSTTSLNKNHNTHIFSEMKSRERESIQIQKLHRASVHNTTKAWENAYVVGSGPYTWNGCEQRKMKCWLKDPIIGSCQRRDYLGNEVRYAPNMVLKHLQ